MKRLFKFLSLILALAPCALLLCGCERASIELSEMMIIQGLGIDVDGDKIIATVEMLNNLQSSAVGGDDTGERRTRVFTSSGESISEAVNNITLKCGNAPLYAHARVVVLGKSAAKKDISDILDFFERDYNTKPSMLICIAKDCTAEEVIGANVTDNGVKSEVLEGILKTGNKLSLVPKIRVVDAVTVMEEETSSLKLPAISVIKNKDNDEFRLSGCAVFNKDNDFVSYIDEKDSSSMLYLDGRVEKGSLDVTLENGRRVSMLIVSSHSKYNIEIKDGLPVFNLKIKLYADLNEFGGGDFGAVDVKSLKEISKNAEKSLEEQVKSCTALLKDELGCDAARLGKRLSLKNGRYYNEVKDNWDDVYKKSTVNVTAEVIIRRTGDEGFYSAKIMY